MIVSYLSDYFDILKETHTEATTTAKPPEPGGGNATAKEDTEKPFSCDHRISLYILNQKYFLDAMGALPVVKEDEPGDCFPAYWASYVPMTNLLMVVVENDNATFSPDCPVSPDTKPVPTPNSTSSREPCHKLDLGGLPRRRLEGCYTYHEGVRCFFLN